MSAARRKGTSAESAVVQSLRDSGWPHVERRALAGNTDRGDIAGIASVMIEVKACKETTIPAWLREVEVERRNAHAEVGVVWHKLRGKGDPKEWAVTMTGEQFMELLIAAGYR